MLQAGAKANCLDRDGWSARHWAVERGHTQVLALIKHKKNGSLAKVLEGMGGAGRNAGEVNSSSSTISTASSTATQAAQAAKDRTIFARTAAAAEAVGDDSAKKKKKKKTSSAAATAAAAAAAAAEEVRSMLASGAHADGHRDSVSKRPGCYN